MHTEYVVWCKFCFFLRVIFLTLRVCIRSVCFYIIKHQTIMYSYFFIHNQINIHTPAFVSHRWVCCSSLMLLVSFNHINHHNRLVHVYHLHHDNLLFHLFTKHTLSTIYSFVSQFPHRFSLVY